jgi:4-hydroxybenzoate polyprenyltransferase
MTPSIIVHAKVLRPHQWVKNTLVFLPLLAAHKFDAQTLRLSVLAFVSFSLVASSAYVVNDLLDLAADRAHPRKSGRPFASGNIPVSRGGWMAAGLLLSGIATSAVVGRGFILVMIVYYVLTLAYSLHLKKTVILDICVLAGLYSMRIFAGGVATTIHLSVWLLAFSTFFFLSLAAVKRQAELVDAARRAELTANGRGYHVDDLPIISMVAIGAGYVAVLVLALYLSSPTVTELYARPEALWGVCVVILYWITRAVMIAHRGQMHDDPVIFAIRDAGSHVCLLLIAGFCLSAAIP